MREIMQNYYATVFMILFHFSSRLRAPCTASEKPRRSCAIKLFIEDSPYIHKRSGKIFETAKRSNLSAAEEHARHARPAGVKYLLS